MQFKEISEVYRTYYVDVDLERAALFKLLSEKFNVRDVLYPGCLMHITPSFYFPHVVYVDRHEDARRFFSELDVVRSYIDRKKVYSRSNYIKFIAQDYKSPLALHHKSFDLLLSLYAGGIANACHTYLKPGGFLLSNNHHDDAGQAKHELGFELIAVIDQVGKACMLDEHSLDHYFLPKKELLRKDLTPSSKRSPEKYTKCASYYLFRKPKRA